MIIGPVRSWTELRNSAGLEAGKATGEGAAPAKFALVITTLFATALPWKW